MIIPPSMVSVMSHDEDCCFQCQEQGNIAQNCPHIRCHQCDKYGHIVMDCPHKTSPSGTPVIHHKPRSHHARSSSRHHHEERGRWSWSRSQSHFQKHHSLSNHNSYRGHSRSQHQDRHIHHRSSSWWSGSTYRGHSHWFHCDTPHQAHCRSSTNRSSSACQSRDHSRSHSQPSYWSSRQDSHRSNSHSNRSWGKTPLRKKLRVKIKDLHRLLQFWCSLQWLTRGIWSFKLIEPSPSSDSHGQGGLPTHDHVTVTLINCPTIAVNAGKCYKALIDSGAAISLIRYSTYQL